MYSFFKAVCIYSVILCIRIQNNNYILIVDYLVIILCFKEEKENILTKINT